MISDKYNAYKLLKEIISNYQVYLKSGDSYDRLKLSDLDLDEDDIVINNVIRTDITNEQKIEFANQLLNSMKDEINDRHVDLESLEETCMAGTWICDALKNSGIIDEYD